MMASLGRALLLAALLPFSPATAQTIVKDGQVIPADETTVAPAAEVVGGTDPSRLQLTDAVLANLTSLELTDISLFYFDDDLSFGKRDAAPRCKAFPGDAEWPSDTRWAVLDLLTGGALIKTVPIGAVCYTNNVHYDAAKCQELLAHWTESATHARDPTSVMSPLYQGQTCQPQNGNTSTCEIGGFPAYAVKIDNIAQIQLALNFARNLSLRLVVQNTGHDFLGKSTGAGALSIWTHNLKGIEFIKKSKSKSYCGSAIKIGAGVQVGELYAAANEHGVTALGGECKGVGVSGGYIAGGGHSPLSSKFGMSSDQVLSIDVVLPNGRFVTASETENTDLFWALRGGGGSTFGVVVGMTVKVYPKMKFSGVTWTATSGPDTNVTDDVFWVAMEAYWRKFPEYADKGSYGYSTVFPLGPDGGYMWSMLPWMIPGISQAQFEDMVAPLFEEWDGLGFHVEPAFFEHDNFHDAWSSHFPVEAVANSNLHTASRLFPRANWESAELLNETMAALRSVVEEGSALIQYNINGAAPSRTPDSAVNPAWRDAVMYGIFGGMWEDGTPLAEVEAINRRITYDWMERLRKVTPGGGGYLNEGDVMEPDFQQAFYGSNYDRLLSIKKHIDPRDVFWAPTAVGSEGWYVTDQWDWLTLETGRLCRKG